jgi:glycosyltransferase involved in cell wall biosynthesis
MRKDSPAIFLSAVVVLTPGHVRFLASVLSDLTSQSLPFSEIIIVASGFDGKGFESVMSEIRQCHSEIVRAIKADPGPAGRNRNIGLDNVSDEAVLVMIHDADDRYPNFRNQLICEQFEKKEFDALLHLFLPTNELGADALLAYMNEHRPASNSPTITSDELFGQTFESGIRRRKEEELAIVDTSLKLPPRFNKTLVHHAHVTLNRNTTSNFRYHERFLPRNEDGLLVRDLLYSGLRVSVLCQPLSVYLVGSSTFSARVKKHESALYWKRVIYNLGLRAVRLSRGSKT